MARSHSRITTRWGEQSWEEMMLGVVTYIYVQEPAPGVTGFLNRTSNEDKK